MAGVDLEFGSVSGATLEGHIFPIVMFQGEIFALLLIISDRHRHIVYVVGSDRFAGSSEIWIPHSVGLTPKN